MDSVSSSSLTGDNAVMQHDHAAVAEHGIVVGFLISLFASVGSWGLSMETLDRAFTLVTHASLCAVSLYGAWVTFAPKATKAWQRLRGR